MMEIPKIINERLLYVLTPEANILKYQLNKIPFKEQKNTFHITAAEAML